MASSAAGGSDDLRFHFSAGSTLGVEVELGIVDRQTRQLAPRSVEVLAELGEPYGGEHPKAKHEFYQSSIEIITGICTTVAEARADLAETITLVQGALEPRGLALMGGGLHPMASWRELQVTPSPRYVEFANTIEWPARRSMCHGIHYHVGVRHPDHAVRISRALAVYLPLFVAVSGSSPYWHGHDTGLASARTKVFEGMPTTGLPPDLPDWERFADLMAVLIHAGTIRSVRELWWDIRPHPRFGTVELRMTDAMATLDEIVALAALAQCLVHDFDRRLDNGQDLPALPEWILKDNKWRACRWGLDGDLIVTEKGDSEPVQSVVKRVVEWQRPTAVELGCEDELLSILDIVAGGAGYQRQRAEFARSGDLSTVVDQLLREWETGKPTGW